MAIKNLQNDFTTPEQSKRLLELGVPADSADCYLDISNVIVLNGKTFQESYDEDVHLARLHLLEYPHYIPCWSVGRLMEIFVIARGYEDGFMSIDGRKPIEYLIRLFTINRNEKFKLDFSKLEE